MTHHPDRTVLETYSGLWFDYTDPDPADIDLRDIARALSLICRFGGQIPYHWSVAQHALLVRDILAEDGSCLEIQLAGLHHDDHEAYVGDVPTPLKNALGAAYSDFVGPIDAAIADLLCLDVELFHHPDVVAADEMALRIEAYDLKPSRGIAGAWRFREPPPEIPVLGPSYGSLSTDAVRNAFLWQHDSLVHASTSAEVPS